MPVTTKLETVPSWLPLLKTHGAAGGRNPHFTPAFVPRGAGPWMCEAEYVPTRFWNWQEIEICVCAALRTTTQVPLAAEPDGGTSLAPLNSVVYVVWAEAEAAIARAQVEVSRMSRRRMGPPRGGIAGGQQGKGP